MLRLLERCLPPIRRSQLAKGDLVFFATAGGRRVSHVGIYTGDGNFLHAPSRGRRIRLSPLSGTYYKSRTLFTMRPGETVSKQVIPYFGPVGMEIELHQPAFSSGERGGVIRQKRGARKTVAGKRRARAKK